LGEGVYSSVGTTSTDECGFFFKVKGARERRSQHTNDGRELRLVGEAAEGGAIVGDIEAPPLGGA
jgi:hypothetical protein